MTTPNKATDPQKYSKGDWPSDVRDPLVTAKAAAERLRYLHGVDANAAGLNAACKNGFGPQHWPAQRGYLHSFDAIDAWVKQPRFAYIRNRLVVGKLPARDIRMDEPSILDLFLRELPR